MLAWNISVFLCKETELSYQGSAFPQTRLLATFNHLLVYLTFSIIWYPSNIVDDCSWFFLGRVVRSWGNQNRKVCFQLWCLLVTQGIAYYLPFFQLALCLVTTTFTLAEEGWGGHGEGQGQGWRMVRGGGLGTRGGARSRGENGSVKVQFHQITQHQSRIRTLEFEVHSKLQIVNL